MKTNTRIQWRSLAVICIALPTLAAEPQLPWQREIPLREAARSVFFKNTLNPTDPLPDWRCYPMGKAMTINNLKMRTTLWGTPDRVTISLMKNNVWDRRINPRGLSAPMLQEIVDGALAPANKDFVSMGKDCQRPHGLGYLVKEGGMQDPYRSPIEYRFPCQKPVGQIIIGMDDLAGATPPEATQSCANGVVKLEPSKGEAEASLQYVLGMTNDLYAIRGEVNGISTPVWLRLYRHRDTTHLDYMNADGKTFTKKGTEADKAFNYPMAPPTSGKDGRYFWIRQQLPPEKTFPNGFEYVLMGVVTTPGDVEIETVEGKTGLGTPPPDKRIAEAPGAAATVRFNPKAGGQFEALVTVVTTLDGPDIMAVAKERLAEAAKTGFDGVARANMDWWNAFYDRRENGRVFYGTDGTQCTDDIKSIYRSYADHHGGGTHTDMRKFECSAEYVHPERDSQYWHSSPCYNEVFTTHQFVRNRADHQVMWKQLVSHWMEGGKDNARNLFGMPGMAIFHGYQPPVKPDKIVHTTLTLEFCLETMAQIIRPSWDEWDYGGDLKVLRDECYPLMREMALFYAAYAKKGDDGHYHVIPSMEPEKWGWHGGLTRNKDVISSLCLFRWALNRAAEAAEILGADSDLRGQWREIARNLPPYPTWNSPEGPVFCAIQGVEPVHVDSDHFGEAPQYPTILSDEINLDSPKEQRETMLRTARKLSKAGTTGQTQILLGQPAKKTMWDIFDAESLLNSRSGRMHLFPAVEPGTEVAFRNFQARGAFVVSAAKNAKEVYFLEVHARRDGVCRIMNPWPGKAVVVREAANSAPVALKLDHGNGECLEFHAHAGKTYSINPDLATPIAKLTPAMLAQEKLGWRIGVEAYTFHKFTFFETIEKTAALGLSYIGGLCSGQNVSKDIPKNFDQNLTDDELGQIRLKLESVGLRLLTYYVRDFPKDEAACRRLFEFANKMGVETFMGEPKPEQLDLLDKLANEYGINIAIHNHDQGISPIYWRPENVLKACEGRSKRIGACPDLGYWLRSGIDPIEALRILKDRIHVVHMHDLHEPGGRGHDVPWGTGIGKSAECFRELHRLGVKPTMIGIEYAHDWMESMPKIAKSIEFFNDMTLKLVSSNP